ncbi:hypothetical protein MC885_003467 [Smutsia gigantea]|nr:hypothetical protein MC885_003467 [Smutsia gigantea]
MIRALTDSQNEELNKAATFVLHNCKKITEKLFLSLGEYSFDENEAKQLQDISMKEKNLEYWKKAKEILHRIERLEREGKEDEIQRDKYMDNISSLNINIQNTLKHLPADIIDGGFKAEDKDRSQSGKLQSYKSHGVISKACTNDNRMKTRLKSANPVSVCYKGNPFTLCSDIINKEVISFLATKNCSKMLKYRCSGCITVGKSLNSRNFSKLLHSCSYQCDHHKAIMEAEDRYKSELRKSLICNKKILLTPRRRQQLSNESTTPGGISKYI